MRIVIGDTVNIGSTGQYRSDGEPAAVEARLLKIRSPRKKRGNPPAGQRERRTGSSTDDPPSGRVVILMVPEGHKIPRGVESGSYKVYLRFVPRTGKA